MSDEVLQAATLDELQGRLWATVAPLLERYQIALVPHRDRSWDVLAFWHPGRPPQDVRGVAFAAVPQAIAALAARCALAAGEGEG